MFTIDHIALIRAIAIMSAWRCAWVGEYPCPNGHGPSGETCYCEPGWDAPRRERLVRLMVALYNTTCERLTREPLMGWDEDKNMDAIVGMLAEMGHEPAIREMASMRA